MRRTIPALLGLVLAACSGGAGGQPDAADDASPEASADAPSGSSDSGADAVSGGDADAAPPYLHVVGSEIRDENDKPVRLLGVNRSGSEYACVQNFGIFDGPTDDTSIAAIASWTANVVRVPLNEDCWLGINGVAAQYSGATYKTAIGDFVDRLLAHGLYVIVELHWSAPGTTLATQQLAMPDTDHSIDFWTDVAGTFKDRGRVVFELFNEPFPDSNQDTSAAWTCWKSGGTCPGISYQAAGMQDLLNAVRGAGAHNLVLLGGVEYSNSLSQWTTHAPTDPDQNIAAAWHVYNFNGCNDATCWNAGAGVVAQSFPIVTTEIGEDDCSGTFITSLMGWLDGKNQSYLGWVWDTWGGCLVLINNYDGTPAGTYGTTFKTHIMSIPH
jgi:endoglucanase